MACQPNVDSSVRLIDSVTKLVRFPGTPLPARALTRVVLVPAELSTSNLERTTTSLKSVLLRFTNVRSRLRPTYLLAFAKDVDASRVVRGKGFGDLYAFVALDKFVATYEDPSIVKTVKRRHSQEGWTPDNKDVIYTKRTDYFASTTYDKATGLEKTVLRKKSVDLAKSGVSKDATYREESTYDVHATDETQDDNQGYVEDGGYEYEGGQSYGGYSDQAYSDNGSDGGYRSD